MRTIYQPLAILTMLAAPVLAGALRLEVSDVSANPEALSKHAVFVTRTTACHEPEKTIMTAIAEGIVDGVRKSIPLKIIPLTTAGSFAIVRAWPEKGVWAVKVVATNPEYKNYATAIVVPVEKDAVRLTAAQHYYHAPTDAEVAAVIGKDSAERAAIN